MKRLLLITILCLTLLAPALSVKADDFCIEGWQMVDEVLVFGGGGCFVWRRTYWCGSTQSEIECEEHQCNDGPVIVSGCQ